MNIFEKNDGNFTKDTHSFTLKKHRDPKTSKMNRSHQSVYRTYRVFDETFLTKTFCPFEVPHRVENFGYLTFTVCRFASQDPNSGLGGSNWDGELSQASQARLCW